MPSIVTATVEPGVPSLRSARNTCEGLVTSRMPQLRHLEHAYLVGRAETVLYPAQHTVLVEAVALQVQHHVHDMLQHARPGDGAFFGDMPDQKNRRVGFLGHAQQTHRAFAHLADAAGRRLTSSLIHGLDRVDDHQRRLAARSSLDRRDRGWSRPAHTDCSFSSPSRSARMRSCWADSSAEIYSAVPPPLAKCAPTCNSKRAFADARIAADQHQRARHKAAAEHASQLLAVALPGAQSLRPRRP